MERQEISGTIRLDQDCVLYQLPNAGWRLPVSEIKIIGEHTDDQGPTVDDYFLVFLTASDLYEVSFYAEGVNGFLRELSDRLETTLSCELGNSTTYKSRVMWPADMEGAPVFDYFESLKPSGFFAGMREKLFPGTARKLSEAVLQKLKMI
jgi:hypothetical protein